MAVDSGYFVPQTDLMCRSPSFSNKRTPSFITPLTFALSPTISQFWEEYEASFKSLMFMHQNNAMQNEAQSTQDHQAASEKLRLQFNQELDLIIAQHTTINQQQKQQVQQIRANFKSITSQMTRMQREMMDGLLQQIDNLLVAMTQIYETEKECLIHASMADLKIAVYQALGQQKLNQSLTQEHLKTFEIIAAQQKTQHEKQPKIYSSKIEQIHQIHQIHQMIANFFQDSKKQMVPQKVRQMLAELKNKIADFKEGRHIKRGLQEVEENIHNHLPDMLKVLDLASTSAGASRAQNIKSSVVNFSEFFAINLNDDSLDLQTLDSQALTVLMNYWELQQELQSQTHAIQKKIIGLQIEYEKKQLALDQQYFNTSLLNQTFGKLTA